MRASHYPLPRVPLPECFTPHRSGGIQRRRCCLTRPPSPPIAGMSVNLRVSTVTSGGYTGLATLSTGALPTGVTATFTPPLLGPNTSGLLTLTTSGSTPSSSSIEVRGTATIEGAAVTRTGTTLLNVQGAGQTVLAGQVRDENDKPLAGVTIKLDTGRCIRTISVVRSPSPCPANRASTPRMSSTTSWCGAWSGAPSSGMTRTGRTSSPRGPLGRPPGGSGSWRNNDSGSRMQPH